MSNGKHIGNVNVLDIRHATEAAVAEIEKIGNVNLVVYSKETATLLSRLRMGNLNATVEAPESAHVRTFSGQTVLDRNFFAELPPDSVILCMGQTIVGADAEAADIETSQSALVVLGQFLCPESIRAQIQAHTLVALGQTLSYEAMARPRLGDVELDRNALEALDDGSDLVVMGKLILPEIVPDDLIERKLRKVAAFGQIVCHEENAGALRSRLDAASGTVTVIPAGFTLVGRPVTLDAVTLGALPARRLYCTGRVEIGADVDPALLDSALERIACTDVILCPSALRGSLSGKCNLLENRVIFYDGALWKVDGEQTLRAARFDYLDGKATLAVFGELAVEADIEPRVLADRLAKVHNFGEIRCTPEQMSALEARLETNAGELVDSTAAEKPASHEDAIGNANLLAL
jgi:hypothetical protein